MRNSHQAHVRLAVGNQDTQGVAAALPRTMEEVSGSCGRRIVSGFLPLYGRCVFAFKREGEDPTRMFAGEGDSETNLRFKRLSEGMHRAPAVDCF